RRFRLRRGLADQAEGGLRALRWRLAEIEGRRPRRRCRHRGGQGASGRHCRGICALWHAGSALAIRRCGVPESSSMRSYLDFEKPVAELEAKVAELRALETSDSAAAIGEEISRLEARAAQVLKNLYAELTPWQKTQIALHPEKPQVARHPERPHCLDYIGALIIDFVSLSGDRKFGDDVAIVGGFGRFRGESVCVIGHEKGSSTESRLKHNFGMARPEGYRKAE